MRVLDVVSMCLLFGLTRCEEVFVWFWGEDLRPAFDVVFLEEVRRVASGDFDFFKLGLSERDEVWFAGSGGHMYVSGCSQRTNLQSQCEIVWLQCR